MALFALTAKLKSRLGRHGRFDVPCAYVLRVIRHHHRYRHRYIYIARWLLVRRSGKWRGDTESRERVFVGW
jgi:hypothetical protein